MYLLAASLMWFGNFFHGLGADARKDFSPRTLLYGFLVGVGQKP